MIEDLSEDWKARHDLLVEVSRTTLEAQQSKIMELSDRIEDLLDANMHLRQALRWYVDHDATRVGGRWNVLNAENIRGMNQARKALGMEEL